MKELAPRGTECDRPAWWPTLWERYVESRFDFRAEPKVLAEKFQQTGKDGAQVLAWLQDLKPAADGRKARLLARVWEEQFEWAPAAPVAPSSGSKPAASDTAPSPGEAKAAPAVASASGPVATSGAPAEPVAGAGASACGPAASTLSAPPASISCPPAPTLQPKAAAPAGAVHNPHEPEAQWAAKGVGRHKKEGVGLHVSLRTSDNK